MHLMRSSVRWTTSGPSTTKHSTGHMRHALRALACLHSEMCLHPEIKISRDLAAVSTWLLTACVALALCLQGDGEIAEPCAAREYASTRLSYGSMVVEGRT